MDVDVGEDGSKEKERDGVEGDIGEGVREERLMRG